MTEESTPAKVRFSDQLGHADETQVATAVLDTDDIEVLRDKVTVKNLGLMHAISTLERDGDEWGVCESLRAAYKA